MGWTRMRRRTAVRTHRRPDMEALEVRTLLSVSQPTGRVVFAPAPHLGAARPADAPSAAQGTNFDAIVGASAARARFNVDGSGATVAVIDSGVNYNHQALGGGLGAGHKVVGGYDFTTNTADPFARTLDHGTAVAGLIASGDPAHPGVAPGADVVALRVFNDSNQGDFNSVADALQWVVDHHDSYHITAVNLSLSDGHNYTSNWFANDGAVGQRITDLVGRLDALNIPVITATGNSFSGSQGEGFTSIIADTISVTATDASDHLVANAQRLGAAAGGASATKLAAPGEGVVAPLGGNSFSPVTGTSFAAPMVTGAVVLMQQVYQQRFGTMPTVQQLDSWLQAGSDPVADPVTGITIGRLDIPRAIGLIPNPALQTLVPPVSAPLVTTAPTPAPAPTVAATPPAPAPPAADTAKAGSSSGSGSTIWVNGQSVSGSDLASSGGKLAGLPSWFVKALQAFQNWWSGPSESAAGKLQVWGVTNPAGTQPAGVVRPHAPLHVQYHPGPAARPWRAFAGRHHGR